MDTAQRVGRGVALVGLLGALVALLLLPGLVAGTPTQGPAAGTPVRWSGTDLLREAFARPGGWRESAVLGLLAALGAAVAGIAALSRPTAARLLSLAGLVATAAFGIAGRTDAGGAGRAVAGWLTASQPTGAYYVALAGFALAFLGTRLGTCGPLG